MKKLITLLCVISTFALSSVVANAVEANNNLASNVNTRPVVEIYDLNSDQIQRFSAARKHYKLLLEQLETRHNEIIESILQDTLVSH